MVIRPPIRVCKRCFSIGLVLGTSNLIAVIAIKCIMTDAINEIQGMSDIIRRKYLKLGNIIKRALLVYFLIGTFLTGSIGFLLWVVLFA